MWGILEPDGGAAKNFGHSNSVILPWSCSVDQAGNSVFILRAGINDIDGSSSTRWGERTQIHEVLMPRDIDRRNRFASPGGRSKRRPGNVLAS